MAWHDVRNCKLSAKLLKLGKICGTMPVGTVPARQSWHALCNSKPRACPRERTIMTVRSKAFSTGWPSLWYWFLRMPEFCVLWHVQPVEGFGDRRSGSWHGVYARFSPVDSGHQRRRLPLDDITQKRGRPGDLRRQARSTERAKARGPERARGKEWFARRFDAAPRWQGLTRHRKAATVHLDPEMSQQNRKPRGTASACDHGTANAHAPAGKCGVLLGKVRPQACSGG